MSNGTTAFDLAEWRRSEREQEREDLRLIELGLRTGNSFDATMHAVTFGLADKVPPMLYRLWQEGEIRGEDLRTAIWEVWVHNKAPRRALGERAWLRLFKAAGFICGTVEHPPVLRTPALRW